MQKPTSISTAEPAEPFDVVELIVNLPQHGLMAGMHGTVLDIHGEGEAFEIEFSDEQGRTLDFLSLGSGQFIVVWRAQIREWVSLPEQIASLTARLPASVGAEVLDFARFLSVRTNHSAHASPVLSVAEPTMDCNA